MKLFNRVSHRIRSQSRKRPPVRLSFDLFEERLLLAAFTVNSNADTNTGTGNTGTLRYVINQLDASEDLTNTIDFDILGPGVQTISPASPLPSITVPVVINGYTQPGAKQNSLANGDNAVLLIELSGASACGDIWADYLRRGWRQHDHGTGHQRLPGVNRRRRQWNPIDIEW